jgi:hypothetical protein
MSQFVTLEEAKRLAKELGTIGGGVLPHNPNTEQEQPVMWGMEDFTDPNLSGIYIPSYAGPFGTPEQGAKKFYHFRFRNGANGFNAGLVKRTMEYAPTRWPAMIATEVNAGR